MPKNNSLYSYQRESYGLDQVGIRMVKERRLLAEEPIDSPEAAIRVMFDFLKEMDRELACIVNLQTDLTPINMHVVSMGALDQSIIHPREILKSAILSNASSIIMIHNHPSGNLKPSKADIQITDRLQQVCELMGIPLMDHIITGLGNEYYSFHEKQTIPIQQLRYSEELEDIHLGHVAEVKEDAEYEPVKTMALPVQGKDLNSIMQSLEMGVQDFLDGDQERYKDYLKVMTKFHNYSLNNTLLIAMQRPDATLCNSYKRWQALGRQVRKGEKGITIIAPAPVKQQMIREKRDENQQPVLAQDGSHEYEEVTVTIPRFKPVTVFAYEQTDGEPLPFLIPEELTASVENYELFMEAIKRTFVVPIRFDEIQGGAKGYYNLVEKEIVTHQGMSESQTMKTAVHECVHSLLHDRDVFLEEESKSRMTKEIEAESCAFCVCAAFNLDTSDYSFPYISGWSKEHDTKELKESLDIIRKTSGELIDKLTNEMQIILAERTSTITFYVAECLEFPVLGEYHEGLTLEEAIDLYEKIPSNRINGIKGIGFNLQDDSIYAGQYELFSGDRVLREGIEVVDHYQNHPLVQQAMKKLDEYVARKQEKQQAVQMNQEEKSVGKPQRKKEEEMSL